MAQRDDASRDLLFGLLALQNGMVTRDQLVAAFGAWTASKRPMSDLLEEQGALTAHRRALLDALAAEHLAAHGGDPEASLAALDVRASTLDTLGQAAGPEVEPSLARVGTVWRGANDAPVPGERATTNVHWRSVCDVFASIVRHDPADRAARLKLVCEGAPALRAEVERLLAADASACAEGFLDDADATGPRREDGGLDTEMPNTLFPANVSVNALQRFRLLRPHAKGGLGAVFVALDVELNREVALKQILDHHADDPSCRQRFLVEAEITGALEHPGIVPVYSLGTYDDGRPYYAMRLIKGDSLRQAIDRFHADEALKTDPGRRSLELRKLLRWFTDVCNAIEYAHSRGVLHRDIKPSNVIVGRFGETLVVDWGLAKPLGHIEPEDATGERTLMPFSASGSAETLPGSTLGTPAYMSPEQAAGDLDRLGPRSDVYSLGATLYSLLTGKAPLAGAAGEVLRKVRRGEFAPPRQLDPSIDRALEAVCLKAMATAPENRYASCRALAEDVERWTADEPVKAWRETFSQRARRWSRRNRTAVAAAAVALVAGFVGLSAVLAVQTRLNTDLKSANDRERAANDRERAAADSMLSAVADVELADDPQIEPIRERLFRDALSSCIYFLNQKGSDPGIRRELARARIRLAQVEDLRGEVVHAERLYREAIEFLDTSAAEPLADLARAWDGLGMVLKKLNRFREAEAALREGLRRRVELAAEKPNDPNILSALAESRYHLGTLLARVKRRGSEDERAYDEAVALQRQLVKESRERPKLRGRLGRYLNNLGVLLFEDGRIDEAEKLLNEASSIQEELIKASPNNPGHRWQRARALCNLGVLWQARAQAEQSRGQADKAETSLETARKLLESLTADFPFVPDYRRELASTYNNLGMQRTALGRREEAEQAYLQAIELQRRLADEFPDMPGDRQRLAKTRLSLALLYRKVDLRKAEAACREAVDAHRQIVDSYPEVPEYRQALGRALQTQAQCQIDRGAWVEAAAALNQAIEHHRAALSSPRDQAGLELLRDDYGVLAHALLAAGDHVGAAAAAGQLPQLLPDSLGEYLSAAAFLLECSDQVRGDQHRLPSEQDRLAENYSRQAVVWLRKALDHGLIAEPSVLDRRELQPLRGRMDFEDLRTRLKTRTNPPYG